jgi:hypothetical protein
LGRPSQHSKGNKTNYLDKIASHSLPRIDGDLMPAHCTG